MRLADVKIRNPLLVADIVDEQLAALLATHARIPDDQHYPIGGVMPQVAAASWPVTGVKRGAAGPDTQVEQLQPLFDRVGVPLVSVVTIVLLKNEVRKVERPHGCFSRKPHAQPFEVGEVTIDRADVEADRDVCLWLGGDFGFSFCADRLQCHRLMPW